MKEEFEQQGNWLFRYRGVLPLFILIAGIGVYLRKIIYSNTSILEDKTFSAYYIGLCLLVCLFGLGIRIYTVGHTPANTSGRNIKKQRADELNTTGIYSVVRHPLYLGNFFMWLGIALLTANVWFVIIFCLLFWLYYERIMFAEEQYLRKKFGQSYLSWAEKTPPFFPRIKNFIKPCCHFSWKKVLKKEKNGLAAVFLVFAFFNVIGALIEKNQGFNYFILFLCLLTSVFYLVLKYLKKNTTILDEAGR